MAKLSQQWTWNTKTLIQIQESFFRSFIRTFIHRSIESFVLSCKHLPRFYNAGGIPHSTMTLWHGHAFRITNPLWRVICGFLSQSFVLRAVGVFFVVRQNKAVEQRVELPVICDNMTLMWRHCNEDEIIPYVVLFVNKHLTQQKQDWYHNRLTFWL